jgi:large subunit ribosomal protein L32
MRRSGANAPLVQNCPECGNPRIPHRVCMSCGTYAREKIIEVASAEADE